MAYMDVSEGVHDLIQQSISIRSSLTNVFNSLDRTEQMSGIPKVFLVLCQYNTPILE